MKTLKYFSIFFISFSVYSCSMFKGDDKSVELKDTWGENGNWSDNNQVAQKTNKDKKEEKDKSNKKEEKKVETKVEEKKVETKVEEKKVEAPKVEEKKLDTPKVEENIVLKDNNISVSLDTNSWKEKDSVSKIKLFSRQADNSEIIMSLTNLKGLNNKLLDNSFKEQYIKSLGKKIKSFQIISNTEENYSNKKAWVISYSTVKNNMKLQQKQVFIPSNDSTIIVNILSNEDTFFKSENDINKTLSTLKIY